MHRIKQNPVLSFLAISLLIVLPLLGILSNSQASLSSYADENFYNTWYRTDQVVSDFRVARSWMWGPDPFTAGVQEDYVEAPNGKRLVQYFDKSRMEITRPSGDKTNQYYVTNGLLARELMTGRLQLGDNLFETRQPSDMGVAGDVDDNLGPSYKILNNVTQGTDNNIGSFVTQAINRKGEMRDAGGEFGGYNVRQAYYDIITEHNIAEPFWNFLNQSGFILSKNSQAVEQQVLFSPTFYATGLPTTEAWWSKVKVAGQVKDVLIQAFERRVLTYTPANPTGFQVEMGNIGRHYYAWRYGNTKPIAYPTYTPTPTTTPFPSATPANTPTRTPTPIASRTPTPTPPGTATNTPIGGIPTLTPTRTPANTPTITLLPTNTATPTITPTRTPTTPAVTTAVPVPSTAVPVPSTAVPVPSTSPVVTTTTPMMTTSPTITATTTPMMTATPTMTATATTAAGTVPANGCLPATSVQNVTQACVDNSPLQNTDVTVFARVIVNGSAVIGASMVATWNLMPSQNCTGVSAADGVASCAVNIGAASTTNATIIDVFFAVQNGRGRAIFLAR